MNFGYNNSAIDDITGAKIENMNVSVIDHRRA